MSIININRKTKIFILIGWFIVMAAVVVSAVLVCNKKVSSFDTSEFTTNPSDTYLNLKVTEKEIRESSYEEDNKDNHFESSTYDFEVLIGKNTISGKTLVVKYLNTILTVETVNGEFITDENRKGNPTASSTQMSKYSSTSTVTFSSFLSKTVGNVDSNVETIDQTPKNIYVELHYIIEVTYTVEVETESGTENQEVTDKYNNCIKYKTSVTSCDLEDTTDSKTLETIEEEELLSVNDETAYVGVYVLMDENSGTTTDLKVYKDTLTICISPNSDTLDGKKIKSVSYEIFGIIENDKYDIYNQFYDKVMLFGFYGMLANKYSEYENTIDTIYNMTKIQVVYSVVLEDGTTQTGNYIINFSK